MKINICRSRTPGFVGWTVAFLLIAYSSARAGEIGGQAGGFLRMGIGADRVAMGDCGVAMTGGEMSWYYNPASLPFQHSKQFSLGYRAMSLDRRVISVDFSTPLQPNAGLSLGVLRAETSRIDARDFNGVKLDPLSQSENLIHGSFALKPYPSVAVGISIKWMINAVPDILDGQKNLYAYAMGLDFGVQAVPWKRLRLGIQVRDQNASYNWETSEVWGDQSITKKDDIPGLVRVGAAYTPFSSATLAADLVMNPDRIGDESEALEPHFGLEMRRELAPGQKLALRTGWNGKALALGLGLDFMLRHHLSARFNYAFLMEQVSPSGSHLIGWVIEI